jgi:hypothetical protein
MYAVATSIWNDIAREQALRTQFARALFPLSADELLQVLDARELAMRQAGIQADVALAYHQLAPLFWEHEAIAAFRAAHPHRQLQYGLPDVPTVAHALLLATAEYRLAPKAGHILLLLLLRPPTHPFDPSDALEELRLAAESMRLADSTVTDRVFAESEKTKRQRRQNRNSFSTFKVPVRGDLSHRSDWAVLEVRSADDERGARELEVMVRPDLLGLVQWVIRLSTRHPRKTRFRHDLAQLQSTPAALREFSALLVEIADQADKRRLKPQPVE